MALTKEQINQYKEELLEDKEDLEEQLKEVKKSTNFSSGGDLEVETDETEEFSNSISIKISLENQLENIEKALERIEKGEYGLCDKCEKEISKEVLEANPASTLCKSCKKKV